MLKIKSAQLAISGDQKVCKQVKCSVYRAQGLLENENNNSKTFAIPIITASDLMATQNGDSQCKLPISWMKKQTDFSAVKIPYRMHSGLNTSGSYIIQKNAMTLLFNMKLTQSTVFATSNIL